MISSSASTRYTNRDGEREIERERESERADDEMGSYSQASDSFLKRKLKYGREQEGTV